MGHSGTRTVRSQDGTPIALITAAQVLTWHFTQLRLVGERIVFQPDPNAPTTREDRQHWMRMIIRAALPSADTAMTRINQITPHSWRAGLAGDLYREGVAALRIQTTCRWNSTRVVRIYAERPPLTLMRSTTGFREFSWVY